MLAQVSKAQQTLNAASSLAPARLPFVLDARIAGALGLVALLIWAIKKVLDTPSRAYNPDDPNVGASYDDWEQ